MTTITPQLLSLLRDSIDEALKSVGEKYGVAIAAGRTSYTAQNADMKLNISVISATGEVISKEVQELKMFGRLIGLKEGDYSKEFNVDGKIFMLHGYASRRPKMPWLIKNMSTGRIHIAPTSFIKRGFNLP